MSTETAEPLRLLVLGGTAEARHLCERLVAMPSPRPLHLTLSLAGVTSRPQVPDVRLRRGGFGGATGLENYLREQRIDLLIDATHPFAAQMTANAARATATTGIPCLKLLRPAWAPQPGDRWTRVPTLQDAAEALPAAAIAFLALGQRHLSPFAGHSARLVVRSIEAPPADLLPHATWLTGSAGAISAETDLLRRYGITHLVTRNSGGSAGHAKLDAARHLGLPVIMIDRPPLPDMLRHPPVPDVETTIRAIRAYSGPE